MHQSANPFAHCIQLNPIRTKDLHPLTRCLSYRSLDVGEAPISLTRQCFPTRWPDFIGDDFCKFPGAAAAGQCWVVIASAKVIAVAEIDIVYW